MRIKKISIVAFAALLITGRSAFGEVGFNIFNGVKLTVVKVFITENITMDDAAEVDKMTASMNKKYGTDWSVFADLNSRGGSVTAALQIGRLLRKTRSLATVGEDSICMSACVYVLAGAEYRTVGGKVGIHRPYEPNSVEISKYGQKDRYRMLEKKIKEYLAEMNIPSRLYEDQLFISPESVRILTERELQEYGLNQNDPFAD